MARPVVGEMEMHSVANLATLQTPLATFFPSKKHPNLVSENRRTVARAHGLALPACAQTSLSLSLSLRLLCSACAHLSLSLSASAQRIAEITAQLLSLFYVYLISSNDGAIIMIVLCRLTSWKGAGYVVLMGHVSVTISYSFRCLTTETVKYTNENSFIENLASSKYSMWAKIGKQMK